MKPVAILLVLAFCFSVMTARSAEASQDKETGPSLGLNRYRLALGPYVIEGVTDDASGLAYSLDTRTLYVVINGSEEIVELDLKGKRKRLIRLKGFEDTEGLVWIKGNRFAVLEERRRHLVLVNINAQTTFVNHAKSATFLIDPVPANNHGIEGVSYDPARDRFFIVKEKKPRKIYEVRLLNEAQGKADITNPWDIEKSGFHFDDLAGIHYHDGTGHLLLLSDESKCIVECTVEGREISRLSLRGGSAGLEYTIGQPEGITMDEEGNLYICSEPNLLYVFSKGS